VTMCGLPRKIKTYPLPEPHDSVATKSFTLSPF